MLSHTRSIVMQRSLKAEFIAREKLLSHTNSVRGKSLKAEFIAHEKLLSHTSSIVMWRSLKVEFIAHEFFFSHTSNVRGRNVAAGRSRSESLEGMLLGGSDLSHTDSNIKIGKECC